jgi:SAM-dependent methyltransferase
VNRQNPHRLASSRVAATVAVRRVGRLLVVAGAVSASLAVLVHAFSVTREYGLGAVLASLSDEAADHGAMVLMGALAVMAVAALAIARKLESPRKLLRRQPLDDAIDWLRLRIDTFPRRPRLLRLIGPRRLARPGAYHELPWIGLSAGRRADSTESRWEAMLPLIEQLGVRSALDVGANVGWFCFAFERIGIPAIAVESDARAVRIGMYARKRVPQPSRVSFLVMDAQPETSQLLPSADCVLFLSVWHHVVRSRGLAVATQLLASLWEKTDRVLFFETGENEFPPSWGLPSFDPDPRTWLAGYLGRTCGDASIIHLGCHDAGIESGGRRAERNLFAVVRA